MSRARPSPVSTERSDVLNTIDAVSDLAGLVENAFEVGHAYAYGSKDRGTDEQTERVKGGGSSDWTGSIVVDQHRARRILRRAAGQIVAWEQKGRRVLEVLAEMADEPQEWEPLEGSVAFGPASQDTTTPEYEYGKLQRDKRRVQSELERIERRKAKLEGELMSAKKRVGELEEYFHEQIKLERERRRLTA